MNVERSSWAKNRKSQRQRFLVSVMSGAPFLGSRRSLLATRWKKKRIKSSSLLKSDLWKDLRLITKVFRYIKPLPKSAGDLGAGYDLCNGNIQFGCQAWCLLYTKKCHQQTPKRFGCSCYNQEIRWTVTPCHQVTHLPSWLGRPTSAAQRCFTVPWMNRRKSQENFSKNSDIYYAD